MQMKLKHNKHQKQHKLNKQLKHNKHLLMQLQINLNNQQVVHL